MQPLLEQSFLGTSSFVECSDTIRNRFGLCKVNGGSQATLPCSARPPTLQLKLAFVIERIDDQP